MEELKMETQYSGYDIVWDDSSLSFAIYKDKVIVKKLIKIYRTKKGYVVESKSVTTDFLRRKRGRKKNVI